MSTPNYTNFPNGASSFGVPLPSSGIGITQGNYYFVKPSSGVDGNPGTSPAQAVKTLAYALSLCTAGQNDTVFLISESATASSTTDYQAVVLDWNKNLVHLIGVNDGTMLSSLSRIANLSTANVPASLLTVSASSCLIANIEVIMEAGANNPTTSVAVTASGSRNHFVNCQFSGNGDPVGTLDDATARSLVVSGAENIFQHCYLGLDTVLRAVQTAEVEVSGARNIFEDCFINSWTSLSTFKAVLCDAPDRFVMFKNCIINAVQNITSAVAPTGAINSGSVNGSVLVLGGGVFGYANVTTANDAKTLVSAPAGDLVDMGLASAVLIS